MRDRDWTDQPDLRRHGARCCCYIMVTMKWSPGRTRTDEYEFTKPALWLLRHRGCDKFFTNLWCVTDKTVAVVDKVETMKTQPLLAACAGLLLSAGLSSRAAAPDRSTLAGRVILPAKRSAPATVLILRADKRPEAPVSAVYPRLPPPMRTDGEGRFTFESLDPAWLYYGVV